MRWRATYGDHSTVDSAACRWAELDRSRLATLALYAHEDDIAPALSVDVPLGHRVIQRVRTFQGQERRQIAMLALENQDRSVVTVWALWNGDEGIMGTKQEGYCGELYAPELFDFEEAVRTS